VRFPNAVQATAFRARIAERGRNLVPAVNPLGEGRYYVRSETGCGGYLVDLKRESCECPSYLHLNAPDPSGAPRPHPPVRCKHLIASLIAANDRRRGSG
jgi:hypothetical protein